MLELKDGEIHEVPADEGDTRKYRRLLFKTHVIYIAGAGAILERSVRTSRSDRELSAGALSTVRDSMADSYHLQLEEKRRHVAELGIGPDAARALAPETAPLPARIAAAWASLRGGPDGLTVLEQRSPALGTELELWRVERRALRRRIAELSVEIHKKFSLPVACVVFVLVGAPLGMRVRRAGPAVAFLSIAFFIFYWVCLVGGEELARRELFPPWLAMWLPNLVLGGIGLDGTLRACEVRAPWHRRRTAPVAVPAPVARTAA